MKRHASERPDPLQGDREARWWMYIAPHVVLVVLMLCSICWLYQGLLTDLALNGHEYRWPYLRAQGYELEFRAGRIPQVLSNTVAGGGSAFPRYYPPVPYWICVALGWVFDDTVRGVHASFMLSVMLSALTFYGMAWRITASAPIAALGALVYSSTTYRFVDVFVRGALAESWTFVWLPPIALGMIRIARGQPMPWYLPLSVGGLLLTHTVMALCLLPATAVALLIRPRLSVLRDTGFAMVLGVALTLWHVIPMQGTLDAVWASVDGFIYTDVERVVSHAPTFAQLSIDDPERWWGFSRPNEDDGMSYALGLGWLIVPATLLSGVVLRLLRRRQGGGPSRSWATPLVFTALWVVTIGVMLYPGLLVRALPMPYSYLQFPWRLLGPAAFLSAAGTAAWLGAVRHSMPADRPWRRTLEIGCLLGAALVVWSVPNHHRDVKSTTQTSATLSTSGRAEARGFTVLGEYLPKELTPKKAASAVKRARAALSEAPGITAVHREGSLTRLEVDTPENTRVVLPTLYYDFYAATGPAGVHIDVAPEGGLVALDLPAGEYTVTVAPRLTWRSYVGGAFGAVALLVILVHGIRRRGSPHPPHRPSEDMPSPVT